MGHLTQITKNEEKISMSKEKTTTAGHTAPSTRPQDLDAIIRQLIAELENTMHFFVEAENVENNLTGRDRSRLFSAGVRNYGFIEKSFDIARDNLSFMPPHFNIDDLNSNLRQLEDLRQLMLTLQQFLQLVTNAFMLKADFCYRDALRIYASLQEQTRNRVPGAEPLFEALRTFFRRRRRESDEPSEMELERDIKKLIHGKADGEIVIENETPHITGGFHKVVDSVHTGRSAFKESAQAAIDEGTSEHKK
jgi:hypothetical protein